MATVINFTTLSNDVTNYIERGGSSVTDATVYAQIPRFINAAERKIVQTLKLLGEIEVLRDPAGLAAGQCTIPKPDRWRTTVSLAYGSGATSTSVEQLKPRSLEFCQTYWKDSTVTDTTQPPLFYADFNAAYWWIAPTSPATYPLQAVCYMQPPLLDAGNQNNFLTEYCGNALLYAALLEAAPFLKNDERIQVWQSMLDREYATLDGQDLQRILDRNADRSRP